MTTPKMAAGEWGMLFGLSVLWGGSFFFIEIGLRALPPFTLVWLRVALAALTLLLIVRALGIRLGRSPKIWAAFSVMALLNNALPFSLITWGQTEIASGLASILNATTPLWTVIVAHYLTGDEKITAGKIMGVVLGFAGVAIMVGSDALAGLADNMLAQIACLAAALSYAFAGVFGRRFRELGIAPLATASGQLTCSTVMLLPVMLFVDAPWTLTAPNGIVWLAIGALALLSTALAYMLYFRILARAGATNLLLVTFLIPVTAIALGIVVLGESLARNQIGGMALIGLGLVAVDGRLLAIGRRKATSPS